MKFDTLKDNFTIPGAEERVFKFWDENKVFERSHEMAKDRPHFVFYEGPPTANGRPGIHHVLSRTIKDMVCRYKAMRGFRVDRKAGWDTHGLPVEIEVEKQLKLDSKAKIVEYGIAAFNQQCKKSVFKYLDEWNDITRRTGYWLDLDDAYVTFTNDYIETVWWILKNFFDRGLIYQGYKTCPFCPRCETGLSSHEVAQGYQEVKDPSVYVKVKAADGDFSYLVWTTTPWTLPSNAALCMSPEADYAMVEHEGEKLVLAEALVLRTLGEEANVLERFKGKDFLKRKYVPLFDTFKDQQDQAFFVINADFVTLEDGTGIVHIAPGFGADDYEVGQKYNLPVFQAIEANGIFKDFAGKYAGMFIKDADPIIIEDMKESGQLLKKELYVHNYPFCWRCDSPLVYIARRSWYLKTTDFKKNLLANSNAIAWHPDEIRAGRMQDWLENNVDWALSRERFWGTPIPIWICEDEKCGRKHAIGSIAELKEKSVSCPDEVDLHKPMMDEVKLRCECGQTMNRIPEVVDVWFDSGAMPFAQWHYPFENKEEFEAKYPADFISEGVDQTRGWFYSLLAISTVLFDKAPFKNVIVHEFILDQKGKKMSKHVGNVVDPFKAVEQYGADPIRWYLVSTSNPWLPTRFSVDGLAEVVRKFFDTLRNTYSFFALYANIDGVLSKAEEAGMTVGAYLESKADAPETFDRWIISRYNSLVKKCVTSLDGYEITPPPRAIQNFVINDLSNWYVRNNRRRFWAKADNSSKMRAYATLHHILTGISQLAAPVMPFLSELLWRELTGDSREKHGLPLSVHMTSYPVADESLIDAELEESMGLAEKIVSLGRAARSRKNLKVRQPLAKIMVNLPKPHTIAKLDAYLDIIRDELNIKEIAEEDNLEQYVAFSAKLNFKTAGSRLGAAAKETAVAIGKLDTEEIKKFSVTKELSLDLSDRTVTLSGEDIEVVRAEKEGYAVESDGYLAVALVTELTGDLINEGFARELVNKIQNQRKAEGFDVTDRVNIELSTADPMLSTAAGYHYEWIKNETLAISFNIVKSLDEESAGKNWNINGIPAKLLVTKE